MIYVLHVIIIFLCLCTVSILLILGNIAFDVTSMIIPLNKIKTLIYKYILEMTQTGQM